MCASSLARCLRSSTRLRDLRHAESQRRTMRCCCRPSIPARISATSSCSDPGAPSIPPAISSFRSICSGTAIPLRRATPTRRKTVRDFPHVTLFDNVACQHRLLTEQLGVRRIALVLGWSMAAMQAYQWAAQYPDMVEAILPYCGAARCSPLNHAFLDGPKAALAGGCRLERAATT